MQGFAGGSGCGFWASCLWQGFLQTLGCAPTVDPATDMTNQWAIVAQASSEYTYRERIGQSAVDDMQKSYGPNVLGAMQRLCKSHYMTVHGIISHMDGQKYMVHVYCDDKIAEGHIAKLPGSEFLKKFAIRIFFGTKQKFREFVNDQLKMSMEQLDTNLRNAGFEIKK